MNTLYYGDNLEILREYIPDESVDLIYPDLPDTGGTLKKAKRIKKASEEKPELGI